MKNLHPLPTVLGLALLFSATQIRAQVGNSSFETPASAGDTSNTSFNNTPTRDLAIQDWSFGTGNAGSGVYGTVNYSTDPTVTPIAGDGSQGLTLGNTGELGFNTMTTGNVTNNDGSLAGSTGFVATVLPNTTYTLSVDIATYGTFIYDPAYANYPAPNNTYYNNANTATLSLIDSTGNVFATQTVLFSALNSTMTQETLSFTSSLTPADLGDGLQIQLGVTTGGYVDEAVFDNVQLTVPEPGTWAMMFAGLGLLVFLRRLRGKSV